MPALVKRRVGSSWGASGAEGTRRCPRVTKKSRKRRRIVLDFIEGIYSD
jgi:hypothetical protein